MSAKKQTKTAAYTDEPEAKENTSNLHSRTDMPALNHVRKYVRSRIVSAY